MYALDFMLRYNLAVALAVSACLVVPVLARAQGQQAELGGCKISRVQSVTADRVPVTHESGVVEMRLLLGGTPVAPVQIDCDEMQLFAEQVEVFDQHRVVATGNVLFISDNNRIAAERLEFDSKTRTGVFFKAAGQASLGGRVDRSLFGTQEPDMYFQGEEIHKTGPNKYKVVRGSFTTCVQPTPRWQMVAGSVTLTLDDHALLKNSVLKVKDVPLMYLPIFYYPIQEDDRATGFLLPNYGTSTVKGHTIRNAFFWAMNRSQDATFYHDWFSKTGQGVGSEYRYVLGPGNQGNSTFYLLDEHEASYPQSDGSVRSTPAKRSYLVQGGLTQSLGAGLHARANLDFYSDIDVQQRYQQNFGIATSRTRVIGANLTGNWRAYNLGVTMQRNDVFYDENSLNTNGTLPRITFSRGERPIGKTKIYYGMNTEYVTHIYSNENQGVEVFDKGLTRFDFSPGLRIPFTRWPFLTMNSSISWRGTYWSESLDARGVQVPESVGRRYFDLQARITGPVLNKIWNTPNSSYAEKFKHVIEPTLTIQRRTGIDVFDRIVQIDGTDTIRGTTQFVYGVSNRIYAKKEIAREIIGVSVRQTYYTDDRAALYDPSYQSSFNSTKATNFSPVQLSARVTPTARFQTDFSTEWSPIAHTITTFALSGTFNSTRIQASAGWSERRLIEDLPGFDNPALANDDLTASATLRNPGNHLGATYSFSYDFRNGRFRQQRYLAFYNAQCCGIAIEYQTYNLGGVSSFIIPQDTRFNLSFTLAGIGSFSNFFGAFGGQNR
jgi:LPS-assembly protein